MQASTVALLGGSFAFLVWAMTKRSEVLDGDITTMTANNAARRIPPMTFNNVHLTQAAASNPDGTERIALEAEWDSGRQRLWDSMQTTVRF